ncbi:MAG TPA: NAD(P)-dependent oxidoreductase [Vicinamibacterales bacterium]|nr:NAD(P)-dependent oxidoreductase [Vicinamibacterales bacterium]
MSQVAFLGTGLLGSAMVESMLRRGTPVAVWNRTSSKAQALAVHGAVVAQTPEEVVAGADEIHIILSDDAAVDALLERIAGVVSRSAAVIDHTTTSPPATRARLERAVARGVRFLHAPVFMGPAMARDSKGVMMVSGPAAVFESVQPSLAGMAADVWYLGEREDLAAALKIFGNSMLFAMTGGIADILAMAKNLGVSPTEAISVFSRFNAGAAISARAQKIAHGDFSASFELTMARKDMRLMLEAAGAEPLVSLPSIAKRMDEAIASGHGRDDLGAIAAASLPKKA